jgi:hypothetical protein
MALDIYDEEVLQVYETLKDRYDLLLNTGFALDEGFTADMPVLVAKAGGYILELYGAGILVLDVMDEARTKGTHWHPHGAEAAVADIVDFMKNGPKYSLQPFPKQKK